MIGLDVVDVVQVKPCHIACDHDLAVDDGALFIVDIDERTGAMVKTTRIDCHACCSTMLWQLPDTSTR